MDSDIETFLHKKAIDFIERGLCGVYLVLNEELFAENIIKVEGYFTLSHKTMCVGDDMSKTKVKKINGFKTANSLHFVLIGQLGKFVGKNEDGNLDKTELSGKELLDYAFEVIYMSSALIPCKCVLVECSEEEKVKKVYEDYGFNFFQHDGEHNQYYKVL